MTLYNVIQFKFILFIIRSMNGSVLLMVNPQKIKGDFSKREGFTRSTISEHYPTMIYFH